MVVVIPARRPAGFRRRRHRAGKFKLLFFSKFLHQKFRHHLLYTNPVLVLKRGERFVVDLHLNFRNFFTLFVKKLTDLDILFALESESGLKISKIRTYKLRSTNLDS
ncbi:hypothetical protein MtrunA17_Chr2g0295331 [Medicago truncatula]|uniref:Uncharacterized protein n=1 Tax=Medicago truncatula TaxID=3880 RepID=A0A396JA40_MEDTR|nr:hypothetical protein MtrunA17_Chr2g0295331 [Medicago truncatula]